MSDPPIAQRLPDSAAAATPDRALQLALMQAIIDSSSDAIVSTALDGQILTWNAGATALFGYESAEVLGQSITIIMPAELRDQEKRILEKVQRGERIATFDTTCVTKDGRRIEVSLPVSPIRDALGTVIGASMSARDVSELKRAERARAQLAAIVESSEDAIISKTLDGIIQSWNGGAARTFGYTAEEAIGQSITFIIPPELWAEERHILAQIGKGLRIEHFDTIRVAKDGRKISVSLTVSPVRDADGTIIGASKVARDISERKQAERRLEESTARLAAEAAALAKLNASSARLWRCRTLEEGLNEMLVAVVGLLGADNGNIQLLGAAGQGLNIGAQCGFEQSFLERFRSGSGKDNPAFGTALRLRQCVIVEDIETDASFAPFRSAARAQNVRAALCIPLFDADGVSSGIVSAHFHAVHRPSEQELHRLDLFIHQASDFVRRCKLEQGLRANEEAMREADRRKDEFLALLAHELRNPLAPIRYALATAKKAGRSAAQQRHAQEVIERQVAHMSRLLDDLMDVSRITRGTLGLKKCQTELSSVVGAATEAARPILDARRHTLCVEMPEQPVRLHADPVRLAQVFCNLLINAAKYTDAGGSIELRAVSEGRDIVVAVRDNGIGIAADTLPKLFTPFTQARTAIERSEGGLGVGLSLVRGLVTLHGGSVEARSEGVGRGSEFVVRLPVSEFASSPSLARAAEAVPMPAGLRVLVVDDNCDAADTCAMLLELSGHEVQTAHTARRALELTATFHPQALLLDIGLPDMSGYELARNIRALPCARAAMLIAVTGWGQEEDRRNAMAAGFNHHLTKPIAAEVLESLLHSASALQPQACGD